MSTQLFEGELIRLAPPEPDRDAEIESKWTHDTEYMRLSSADPMRPLSPTLIKKKYEEAEKEQVTQWASCVKSGNNSTEAHDQDHDLAMQQARLGARRDRPARPAVVSHVIRSTQYGVMQCLPQCMN